MNQTINGLSLLQKCITYLNEFDVFGSRLKLQFQNDHEGQAWRMALLKKLLRLPE